MSQKPLSQSARKNNILAARIIAQTVKTTLGPKGMDKVLVDDQGNITITNDGATILSEMSVEHPIARMIVEIAQTQELEVGDGTTSAVILAGELLKNADDLLDKKIHPTIIAQGYGLATTFCLQELESLATSVEVTDTKTLIQIAKTAMTGKSASSAKEILAQLCVDALTHVSQTSQNHIEDITILTQPSGLVSQSRVEPGIIIDKAPLHGATMQVDNPKIALLTSPIELRQSETDTRIQITNPNQMQSFLEQEESLIKQMVETLQTQGVTAVFTTKGIDELAQHYLQKAGIAAFRRVKVSDMQKLAKATNARIVNSLSDLQQSYLGDAKHIKVSQIQGELYTFIQDTPNRVGATILLHASTRHVVDELKRAVEDALGDLCAVLRAKKIVYGAGAIELSLAKKVKEFAQTQSGKEQLAILAFAQSLEVIPATIAENAGLDPIDVLTQLRLEHEKHHYSKGIDVLKGVLDAKEEGVLEPMLVKHRAITSACEVANVILRIDDVIYCGPITEDELAQARKQLEQSK